MHGSQTPGKTRERGPHQIETVFKAFGRAVRMAIEIDPKASTEIPSTKGSL